MKWFMKIILFFSPPDNWKFPVMICSAIFTGCLILLIYVSNAGSYLSDDPKTCINCHVMFPYYASWQHGSHFRVATCNDCHVPHNNVISKYMFKASDGLRHATIFTLRNEPQVIKIRQAGINVVQENCIRCHRDLVDMVSIITVTGENHNEGEGKRCWDCHREVPHGTVNSLSSSPDALIPLLPSVVPDWLRSAMSKEKTENEKSKNINTK